MIFDLSDPTKVVSTRLHATLTCAITQLSSATNDYIIECQFNDNSGRYNNSYTVPEITTAVDVAVGQNHIYAVLDDGSGRCYGDNSYDQALSSITVSTLQSKAISTYAWDDYTCASLEKGGYTCWVNGSIW